MYRGDIIGNGRSVYLMGNEGQPIKTLGDALDIHSADVHIEMKNRRFANFPGTNTTTLILDASAGDISIDIQTADYANYNIGDELFLKDGNKEETGFPIVTDTPGSPTLTLDGPLDKSYASATTTIEEVITNLATANGSLVSPVSFIIRPSVIEVIHILRMNIAVISNSESASNLFLSLPALTNGVIIRKNINGVCTTQSNWKIDIDIMADQYDLDPVPKAPANQFGQRGRWWYKRADAIVKLNGSTGDFYEMLIQDNLTGESLLTWITKGQGHLEGV